MITLMVQNSANYDDHPGWLDRLGLIANQIKDSGADVVCLSEIRYTQANPFNTYGPQYWTNQQVAPPPDPASMADQILTLLNAGGADDWACYTDRADQYGPEQWEGLSILSSLPMSNHGTFPMPFANNERITQYVDVRSAAGDIVTIYNTHLALNAADRVADAETIVATLPDLKRRPAAAFLLVGDMNGTPDDRALETFANAGYVDAWAKLEDGNGFTFPSNSPQQRIDYVWTSPALAGNLQSIAIATPWTSFCNYDYSVAGTLLLSDHLGLVATFDR